MGVTPKKKVDLVGDERQRRMKTAQLAVLPVASDAARQYRDAETGEREALDQFEIPARQEPGGKRIHRRELVDDLLALQDSSREDERSSPQPRLHDLEVAALRSAVRQDEEVDCVAKGLQVHQVRMALGSQHDSTTHPAADARVE